MEVLAASVFSLTKESQKRLLLQAIQPLVRIDALWFLLVACSVLVI
jgi:hypothetical protein